MAGLRRPSQPGRQPASTCQSPLISPPGSDQWCVVTLHSVGPNTQHISARAVRPAATLKYGLDDGRGLESFAGYQAFREDQGSLLQSKGLETVEENEVMLQLCKLHDPPRFADSQSWRRSP